MNILQIGCNNGDDEVFDIISNNKISFALLIDANPYVLELTREHYKKFKNVHIEQQLVLSSVRNESLYIPHFDAHKYSPHSSIFLNHIIKHGHSVEDSVKIDMRSITLELLLNKYKLKYLDYLSIDCEGVDYEILNSTNFYDLDIKKIKFEHDHIPNKNVNYPSLLEKLNTFSYEVECVVEGNTIVNKKSK